MKDGIFNRKGNSYFLGTAVDTIPVLPPAVYALKFTEMVGFYLEQVEDFELPKKIYGSVQKHVNRYLKTFRDRPGCTGIVLAGEKGSGKTLTAKTLSIEAARTHKIPTIVVNHPHSGDRFNTFLQGIVQECIILFDEFEKVYDYNQQKELLTLFDGTYTSKKLFILTVNNTNLDANLQNRPGRIFYRQVFNNLEDSFIDEYTRDTLVNQDHFDQIKKLTLLYHRFNFDMLKSVIEECNRYNEEPFEAVKWLNMDPTTSKYRLHLSLNGVPSKHFYPEEINCHPLNLPDFIVTNYDTGIDKEGEENEEDSFTLRGEDLVAANQIAKRYRFKPKDKEYVVDLEEIVHKAPQYTFAYGNLDNWD